MFKKLLMPRPSESRQSEAMLKKKLEKAAEVKQEKLKSQPQARPVKSADVKKQYARHPTFADLLPYEEWSEDEKVLLLEDGLSLGCLFELRDISSEAKPEALIQELHTKIAHTLARVVPLEEENPWVLQFFVQDDPTLTALYQRLKSYIPTEQHQEPLTQRYLELMKEHFKTLAQAQGLFEDPLSGLPFRGRTRRVRLALYRRYTHKKQKPTVAPLEEINQVAQTLMTHLQSIGVQIRRLRGKHLYEWLVRWFNPAPISTSGNVDTLLEKFPYPGEEQPFGWSLAQNIFFSAPVSTLEAWQFDGLLHRLLVFRELPSTPDIGVISRERSLGDSRYALLDKLPDGSIYTLQLVMTSQKTVEKHLDQIAASAVGKGDEPKRVKYNVARAYDEIKGANKLFKVTQALYYRGHNLLDLQQKEKDIEALLINAGLSVIRAKDEINPLDNYLRFLPFAFNAEFDKKYVYRSTYQYASDIAALLPLYGRSRGDGLHPLHVFFNRGGEGFIFDHLNKHFKMANSHLAVIGSTGAGKSVFLNMLLLQLLVVSKARIYLIEAGGSFNLTADYIAHYGKEVKKITFDRLNPIAINPFAESYRALELIEAEEALFAQMEAQNNPASIENQAQAPAKTQAIEETVIELHATKLNTEYEKRNEPATDTEKACAENRDILSEMALAVRTMVTGGLDKEEEKFSLADDMLVMEVLIAAIKACKARGVKQVLTQHVIEQFQMESDHCKIPELAKRLQEMTRALKSWVANPMKAQFFNRPSEPLAENDLTVVNLGFLQEKQNSAMLSLVAISLLSKILAVAEAQQYSDRPTVLIMDEAHILFKNPLLATFVILMSKVARKYGLWLIPCTQNVEDFSTTESKKVLSMMETWICLAVDKKEIANLQQFKNLTEEEIALLSDIKKYPGLYSEGVLLGSRYKGLFRNVPPRLALALAMTEQTEKAQRRKIMEEQGVTELQAAEIVAQHLETYRPTKKEDEGFDD